MTDTTGDTADVAPLTDPGTLRDRDDVDYLTAERTDDEEHFERHDEIAGFAAVAVTNADGDLALARLGDAWILPHASVDLGEDFVDVAERAADDLLGIDVEIASVVRARRKHCTLEDGDRETVIHDVIFEASPANGTGLPDASTVQSCQAEATDWFDHVPEKAPDNEVREDMRLFVG